MPASLLLGARLRALRAERNLTQEELARRLGFNDRQTLSAIENGDRRLSADELLLAAQTLGEPLDNFTDPFLLIGEGRFSWRQTGVAPGRLADVRAPRRPLDRSLSNIGSAAGAPATARSPIFAACQDQQS